MKLLIKCFNRCYLKSLANDRQQIEASVPNFLSEIFDGGNGVVSCTGQEATDRTGATQKCSQFVQKAEPRSAAFPNKIFRDSKELDYVG